MVLLGDSIDRTDALSNVGITNMNDESNASTPDKAPLALHSNRICGHSLQDSVSSAMMRFAVLISIVVALAAADDADLDELDDKKPFDFLGLFILVGALVGLGMGVWKLAGRGDLFGEGTYLERMEMLAQQEAAEAAEKEKAAATEFLGGSASNKA